MSKPLELAVFEKEPGRYSGEPRYHSPDGFWAYPASHVDGYAADKHFTDAELAAEYWCEEKSLGDVRDWIKTQPGYSVLEPVLLDRVLTFDRFASLPRYD